jgi:hypothetical protein
LTIAHPPGFFGMKIHQYGSNAALVCLHLRIELVKPNNIIFRMSIEFEIDVLDFLNLFREVKFRST